MTARPGRPRERHAWIALASTAGVGHVWFERLIASYGSASEALAGVRTLPPGRADRALAARLGLRPSPGLAERLRISGRDLERTERQVAALGGWALTPLDRTYPARLGELEDPPPVLYGLGRQEVLDQTAAVAVVGTRRPTGQGRHLAGRVAARLAQLGVAVVSGLAVGIDGAAHAAAVEAGGTTLGVAGSGLEAPAPQANRHLVRAILRSGSTIVSELAPGVRPSAGTFPRRNRIISVLSGATIVIEAPARSGALITARLALEQGRRVLVAPGRPLDPAVAGCLALLRETPARPLVGLDEMAEDLELWPASAPAEDGEAEPSAERASMAAALSALSPAEREVAIALMTAPQSIDSLVRETRRAPGEAVAAVTLLQLRGWARSHGSVLLAAGALLDAASQPGSGSRPPGGSARPAA